MYELKSHLQYLNKGQGICIRSYMKLSKVIKPKKALLRWIKVTAQRTSRVIAQKAAHA